MAGRRSTLSPWLATLCLLFLTSAPLAAAATDYTWLFTSTVDGWTWSNANCSAASGALHILPTTSDPQTRTPTTNFVPSSFDYLRINIRSTSSNNQFQIYYTNGAHGYSESFSKIYNINNDGAYHYATIPLSSTNPDPQLSGVPGWASGGNITQIRLDPARASGGAIDYDFVAVRRDDRDPYAPVVDAVSPSGFTAGTITVTAHGDDPPPFGFGGNTNPDKYASGVYDFGWRIDGGAESWQPYTNGYDQVAGTAYLTLTFPAGLLSGGCHTLSLRSRDRCGRIGPSTTATLFVGSGYRIVGRSTSFETGDPVAGDKITYGAECGPVTGNVFTDANGYYQTPYLPLGSYSVGAGSCDDIAYTCGTGNPIVIDCGGDKTANFRQKGLIPPTNVFASPGADGQSITLTWDGGNANTATFVVSGSDAPEGTFVALGQSQPPFTEVGLTCGQVRYYTVAAVNACTRQGQPSAPVTASTLSCPTLRGTVVDGATQSYVAGAAIELHQQGALVASASSDSIGAFDLGVLQPGDYDLVAYQPGTYPLVTIALTLHPGDAVSQTITLSVPAGPYNLTAVANQLSNIVALTWQNDVTDVAGFELQRKVTLAGDETYLDIAAPSTDDRSYDDSPQDGLAHEYRIRGFIPTGTPPMATRGMSRAKATTAATAPTLWSNRCLCSPLAGWSLPPYPALVEPKNYGDASTIHVRVSPPAGTCSWAGVQAIVLNVYDNSARSHLVASIPISPGPSSNPITFTFLGGSQLYWFGARLKGMSGALGAEKYDNVGGIRPDWAPVVFVHGIWSKPTAWNSWDGWFAEDNIARRTRASFECSGDTWEAWRYELRSQIEGFLGPGGLWPNDERVDIVAHSQGGLAARSYIEELRGSSRVRALVMVGTPNHGGDLATLSSWLRKLKFSEPGSCDWAGRNRGADLLQTNHPRLKKLNFGTENVTDDACDASPLSRDELAASRKGTTEYYLFAGTGNDPKRLLTIVAGARTKDRCSTDGIVKWPSVRLRSLSHNVGACRQWFDSDITSTPLVHDGKFIQSHTSLARAELESRPLAGYIATQVLRPGGQLRSANLCSGVGPSAMVTDPSADGRAVFYQGVREQGMASGLDEVEALDLAATRTDSLVGGEERLHSVQIDSCSSFTVLVSWPSLHPVLALIDPNGTRYSAADTSGALGLTYEEDDSLSYAAFELTAPTPGTWTISITGDPSLGTQVYTESWVVQGAPYRLQVAATATELQPGQEGLITASMIRSGVPYPASLSARVTSPSGQSSTLSLQDDGTAGDGAALDGVYSGSYVIPPEDGRFEVNVSGILVAGNETVMRAADTTFTAVFRPDLVVEPRDIRCSPTVGAVGESLYVMVMVHNRGAAHCDSFEVAVRDSSTEETIAVGGGSVAAQDSTLLSLLWIPGARGEHNLSAEVVVVSPAELSVDNNSATTVVAVSGPTPILVGIRDEAPSLSFSLAAPRPNPSSNGLRLNFRIPKPSLVRISVFDVQGRLVRMLLNEVLQPGAYNRTWDARSSGGRHVSSGVYFIEMVAPTFSTSRKVVLLR